MARIGPEIDHHFSVTRKIPHGDLEGRPTGYMRINEHQRSFVIRKAMQGITEWCAGATGKPGADLRRARGTHKRKNGTEPVLIAEARPVAL